MIVDILDRHPGQDDFAFDADGDGAPDPIDRYALGDDFADDDGDGWSNAWDPSPLDPHLTIAEMIVRARTGQDQVTYAQEQVIATARDNGLATDVSRLEVINTILEVTDRDTDGDQVLDTWDTHATLDEFDDPDGDGYNTGSDYWPTDPDAY